MRGNAVFYHVQACRAAVRHRVPRGPCPRGAATKAAGLRGRPREAVVISEPVTPRFASLPSTTPAGAYVHLPFCKRKCRYCDFPVVALGRASPAVGAAASAVPESMQRYVAALLAEIHAQPVELGASASSSDSPALQTVYFGGGTPALVPPHLLGNILDTIVSRFGIAGGAEITLEADPGTFDAATLRRWRDLGVNRLSLGVQSFESELLARCGRSHSAGQVLAAIDAVSASSIDSWSLDLMAGLPGLSLETWRATLEHAILARPDHLAVYDLQVGRGIVGGPPLHGVIIGA